MLGQRDKCSTVALQTGFVIPSAGFASWSNRERILRKAATTLAVHGGACYNFWALFKAKCRQQMLRLQNPNRLIHS